MTLGGIIWLVYLMWGENIKEGVKRLWHKIRGTDETEREEDPVMVADSNAGFEPSDNMECEWRSPQ